MRPSEALEKHRGDIAAAILRYPLADPRVFGSTARRQDREDSDLDILVRTTGDLTYFDLARLEIELESLTGVRVDVRTEGEFSPMLLERLARDFQPL